MCAPLKSQGKLLWAGGCKQNAFVCFALQRGYRLCKDPDFRKHFGKEYQWLCDCGGWDVTLCHSSVSIYPGFHSFLEKFHFCVYPIYAWKNMCRYVFGDVTSKDFNFVEVAEVFSFTHRICRQLPFTWWFLNLNECLLWCLACCCFTLHKENIMDGLAHVPVCLKDVFNDDIDLVLWVFERHIASNKGFRKTRHKYHSG